MGILIFPERSGPVRYSALCLILVSSPVAAQSGDPRVAGPTPAAIAIPDTARRYPPSHWKSGLLAGAAVGALLGAGLAGSLCTLDETDTSSCLGTTIGGALMIATAGGSAGALIGSLFPRDPQSSNEH